MCGRGQSSDLPRAVRGLREALLRRHGAALDWSVWKWKCLVYLVCHIYRLTYTKIGKHSCVEEARAGSTACSVQASSGYSRYNNLQFRANGKDIQEDISRSSVKCVSDVTSVGGRC